MALIDINEVWLKIEFRIQLTVFGCFDLSHDSRRSPCLSRLSACLGHWRENISCRKLHQHEETKKKQYSIPDYFYSGCPELKFFPKCGELASHLKRACKLHLYLGSSTLGLRGSKPLASHEEILKSFD